MGYPHPEADRLRFESFWAANYTTVSTSPAFKKTARYKPARPRDNT